MKKLSLVALFVLSFSASANVEPLLGSWSATDLGCANAGFARYGLTIDMDITDFESERNSATRNLEVYVNVREAGVECRVWYTGPISFVEGAYYGSLYRSDANGGRGYNCGALNDRQASGIVSTYIDPFFLEADVITPLNVSANGNSISIQQTLAPQQPIRGCGNSYPVYSYQRK